MSLPTSSARSSLSHISVPPGGSTLPPERPGLARRLSSGQGNSGGARMHPPEKRRASRSPEADEEDRRDRERGPMERERERERDDARKESDHSPTHRDRAAARPESPMDES